MYINKKTRDKINEINTFTDAFRNSIGFEKWLDDKKKYIGIKEKNKCICSKCQKEFISNKKINNYDTCPNCNQKLLIKRSRRFDDKEYCMYLINYKDDNYILRNYEIRSYLGSNDNMKHIITEYGRQLIDNEGYVEFSSIINTMRRTLSGYFYINYTEDVSYWKPELYVSTYGSCYVDNGTVKSKYFNPRDIFINSDEVNVEQLLGGLYENNYSLELLSKAKLYNLANDYYCFKKGKFEEVFGLDRSYLKFMQDNNVTYNELELLRQLKIKDYSLIKFFSNVPAYLLKDILELCNPYDLINYKIVSKGAYLYCDYLKMAKELKYNLKDKKILYPKKLKAKHDQLMKEIQIKKDKALNKKIKKRYKKLLSNYYEDDKYIIYPVKDINELIDESSQQNNCVKTYAERYAKAECDIYFMRLSNTKDKSLVTVEVRNNEIVQQRTKNNNDTTKEQKKFLKKWEKNILRKGEEKYV